MNGGLAVEKGSGELAGSMGRGSLPEVCVCNCPKKSLLRRFAV